ncbi:MAG: hypothetical protein A3D92_08805 [Bacteroidetes bacterium RIFCSPHIGHO2_02_FULL_44_7]|nr:MAG: hypothetical protein A3D92_08805 [Bacteroidetes bacterium RIFCSPHIGHO2_02_FULL_44_7]
MLPTADILHLVFPNLCLACERELSRGEEHLCSFCQLELTPTRHRRSSDPTSVDQVFWGRVPVQATYAHYFFEKKKAVQNLLFSLKYGNNQELGSFYGREIGKQLKNTTFASADALIPVPLHPRKEFLRGYNQSFLLAKGISEILRVPVDAKTVARTRHTATQTRKSRFQRWDNVHDIFSVKDAIKNYQHVVLIDDVITTGSTLESLIVSLRKKKPELSVSVVTLATA